MEEAEKKMEQLMNIELDPDNKTLIHLMTTLNREKGRESHGREHFDASDFNC